MVTAMMPLQAQNRWKVIWCMRSLLRLAPRRQAAEAGEFGLDRTERGLVDDLAHRVADHVRDEGTRAGGRIRHAAVGQQLAEDVTNRILGSAHDLDVPLLRGLDRVIPPEQRQALVRLEPLDICAGNRPEAVDRILDPLARRPQPGDEVLEVAAHRRLDDLVHGAEVVVDGAARERALVGHFAGGAGAQTVPDEDGLGCRDDLLALVELVGGEGLRGCHRGQSMRVWGARSNYWASWP